MLFSSLQRTSAMLLSIVAAFLYFTSTTTPASAQDVMYVHLNSTPTDVQVSLSDGFIIVSAGLEVIRLTPDFLIDSTAQIEDRRPGYRIAISHNTSESLLVCKEDFCTKYLVDWEYGEFYDEMRIGRGFDLVPLSLEFGGFYIGTSDGTSIIVLQIDPDYGFVIRDYDEAFNDKNFDHRKFLHGFEQTEVLYFVVQDNGTTEITNNIRIMRFCNDTEFNAAYEAILDCGTVSDKSKVTVSITQLDVFTLTVAVTTDDDTNICSFSLDDINSEMDASYSLCSSGDHNNLSIPLAWYNERTCEVFSLATDSDTCNFNLGGHIESIPALAAFNSVSGQQLLHFNDSEEITAILAFSVNRTDLLLLAYSLNDGNHLLDKYHITSEGRVDLILSEKRVQPVTLLRWNEMMEEIYGADIDSVFGIPLETCDNYTTCDECTSSRDPLCGWCVLEQMCSRELFCPSGREPGHWVHDQGKCIVSVSLTSNSMDVDFLHSVELMVEPEEAVLPSLPVLEYQCNFHHDNHNNNTYGFVAPFNGGACLLQQAQIADFVGKRIDLNFTLTTRDSPSDLFPSSSVLTLHNCSLHADCGECVEASTSCGWCVYDRICTGNSSHCRVQDDWRSMTDIQIGEKRSPLEVCPAVLLPSHGTYTQPAAADKDLVLTTLNIPPQIEGYHYGCQLKYGNGSTVQLVAEYYNATVFRCLVSENQVYMSGDVANGTEAAYLELLWIQESDNSAVTLHSIKVTLYDCMQLGTDCSSCLSANLGTGFQCVWCDRIHFDDSCTVTEFCLTEATIANHISKCPVPVVIAISPMSGPTAGGTVLTVNGSNLGAVAADVRVDLVNAEENISCIVDGSKYIPGLQIVCTTQAALEEGDHSVTVRVLRGVSFTLSHSSSESTFRYAHPIASKPVPLQGPKAGGTEITIFGSNLDISSHGSLEVFLGDIQCDITSVISTEVVCISRPAAVGSHRIHIRIDNANIASEQYNYRPNPIFTKVEPQFIIPAGGVTMSFKGRNLDVVLNPVLIVDVDNDTLRNVCKPKSSSLLKCTTPKLPESAYPSDNLRLSRSADRNINYTIMMDGAEGPDSTKEGLLIGVNPNPVFTSLHAEDREYILESGNSIRILGSNIDSVLASEISVVINGEGNCTRISDVTSTQFRCFPPDTITFGDKDVKVFVGENGLNYSVGFLRYREAQSSGGNNSDLLLVIIPALAGLAVLVLTVLAVLCCFAAVSIRRKRTYKIKQRATFGEEDKSNLQQVEVMPNVYNGSRHHQAGDHDYDTIPDVLEQMQLQQMELMACSAVGVGGGGGGGDVMPLTSLSPKQGGNIYFSEDEGRGSSASSNQSRPQSSSTFGSRPHSSSTTGSVSNKPVKRSPLPPLPTSMSDEYVAMRSYSTSDGSLVDDTAECSTPQAMCKTLPSTLTTVARVSVYEPAASDEDDKECTDVKVEGLKLEEDDTTGKAIDKDPKQYPQESSA